MIMDKTLVQKNLPNNRTIYFASKNQRVVRKTTMNYLRNWSVLQLSYDDHVQDIQCLDRVVLYQLSVLCNLSCKDVEMRLVEQIQLVSTLGHLHIIKGA